MTTYLLKLILCSALFFVIYKLLFEREKMLQFNRFYLLISVVFSFVVPLLTIRTALQVLPAAETPMQNTVAFTDSGNAPYFIPGNNYGLLLKVLLTIYVGITAMLLIRFARNLKSLLYRVAGNSVVPYYNAKLVLVANHLIPHSFLQYIFIPAEEYDNGKIEPEVLYHELAHVQQKHSLDVLFIELVQAVAWFNPIFILYRGAIQLNHEFLADESVILRYGNMLRYQELLIDKAARKSGFLFASPFNYSITKRRLIMMTKSTSRTKALCKQLALMPLIAGAILMFGVNGSAQDPAKNAKPQKQVQSTSEGVSQALLDEYEALISKNQLIAGGVPGSHSSLSDAERNRLETIFFAMSKGQQAKQAVSFSPPPSAAPRKKPTAAEFEMNKNPRKYAIRIDEKKVPNSTLNNYKPDDFWGFAIIYLAKTNLNYSKHLPLNVYLMTEVYYKEYVKQGLANTGNIMIVRTTKKPGAE